MQKVAMQTVSFESGSGLQAVLPRLQHVSGDDDYDDDGDDGHDVEFNSW